MTSARDFILEVIDLYREHECLWRIKHEDYHNKIKRNVALDAILELFKTKDPTSTRESVLKRLQNMRGSFNKELRKIKASQTSGSDPESVHVPKLWYYSNLIFLQDQDVPRNSQSSSSIIDALFDEENTHDTLEEVLSASSSYSSVSSTPSFKRPPPKADVILEKIARRLDGPFSSTTPVEVEKPKEHDVFGQYVAEKLRSIKNSQVPFCQKVINDAIFLAQMNSLNVTSKIVTEYAIASPVLQSVSVQSANLTAPTEQTIGIDPTVLAMQTYYDAIHQKKGSRIAAFECII